MSKPFGCLSGLACMVFLLVFFARNLTPWFESSSCLVWSRGRNDLRSCGHRIEGRIWRHSSGRRRGRITDREMVEFAQKLQGWTGSVYRFGCAFIHLSRNHDYLVRDPFRALPKSEQRDILKHLRYYHGGPTEENPSFSDLLPLLPQVFRKISDNLRCYVEMLEKGRDLRE
jgi:hypothetical protein